MARHGNSRHMKRIAASPYPRIGKKAATYLAKPRAGRHTLKRSVALLVVLRDKLHLVSTKVEAKKAIGIGSVQVNGRIVKDEKYPIGFGDTIGMVKGKESYRVGIGRGADIKIEKIEQNDGSRTLKVVGKYLASGSRVMVRLYDGTSVTGSAEIKINDSVVVDSSKIKEVLKFKQGAKCLVVEGTHASETGVIKEIKGGSATSVAAVKIESQRGTFETPVKNVMVVGA